MYWLYLIAFFIVHIILFPLKLLVSIIVRLAWRPGVTYTMDHGPKTATSPKTKWELITENLDLRPLFTNQDGCKYMGLAYVALENAQHPKAEDVWAIMRGYWVRFCGTFSRTTAAVGETWPTYNESIPNFSGDMLSGLMYAAAHRPSIPDNVGDSTIIANALENSIFKYPFNQIKHPIEGVKTDRGVICSMLGLGDAGLQMLVVLGYLLKVKPSWKYRLLYWAHWIAFYPLIIFAPEIAVWVGKYYGLAWYDEHSQALFASAGLKMNLPGSVVYMAALDVLKDKYKWNPDIQALYAVHCGLDYPDEVFVPDLEAILEAYNPWQFMVEPATVETTKFFSLRSFVWKDFTPKILSQTESPGHAYKWEENFISQNKNGGKGPMVDYLHLYSLVTNIIPFWPRV